MSKIDLRKLNRGSYDHPHSGVGIEYLPLGSPLRKEEILIHEVGYLEENDWWMFPNTVSPFWRLYYNSQPGHKVVLADREIPLEPGHILLIPDHQMFHSIGSVSVPHFWMAFSTGLILKRGGPQMLPVQAHELELISRIRDRISGPGRGDTFTIYHESAALLHLLLARPEIDWSEAPRSPSIQPVVEHIAEHFAKALDVPSLAQLAGMTPRAMSALFQREYHVSPTRFIARVRVSEAARLLADTDLSLDSIAEHTGFPNRFYLTRVFTKLTGKSPALFRREQRPG